MGDENIVKLPTTECSELYDDAYLYGTEDSLIQKVVTLQQVPSSNINKVGFSSDGSIMKEIDDTTVTITTTVDQSSVVVKPFSPNHPLVRNSDDTIKHDDNRILNQNKSIITPDSKNNNNNNLVDYEILTLLPFEASGSSTYQQTEKCYTEAISTAALQIDRLSWWTTDKDIIQIAYLATKDPDCVNELSFYEHKVNGKSRGSVWILFKTVECAAKTKAQFESIEIDQRVPIVSYTDPAQNPFKTLPKEPHLRNSGNNNTTRQGSLYGNNTLPLQQQQQQQQSQNINNNCYQSPQQISNNIVSRQGPPTMQNNNNNNTSTINSAGSSIQLENNNSINLQNQPHRTKNIQQQQSFTKRQSSRAPVQQNVYQSNQNSNFHPCDYNQGNQQFHQNSSAGSSIARPMRRSSRGHSPNGSRGGQIRKSGSNGSNPPQYVSGGTSGSMSQYSINSGASYRSRPPRPGRVLSDENKWSRPNYY